LLDFKVTEKEVGLAIKNLKNNKSQGPDQILNEMIKYSQHVLLPSLTNCFNLVLEVGDYPDGWSTGYITPLYKSGDQNTKDNYRGITITSCLGKLFNAILNRRLDTFMRENNVDSEFQCAYKKHSRPSDHVFVLRTIIEKTIKHKKDKLFACFVDFKKAFDSVSHAGLLCKLLRKGIDGQFYNTVKSMYSKSMLQVRCDLNTSQEFPTRKGIRQGDNLSPNLFKIFLADLPSAISSEEANPPNLMDKSINCLMFADDVVLLSKSESGLQSMLNELDCYCANWGLTVNAQKTKIMTFNSPGRLLDSKLTYRGVSIENVRKYKYLGVVFQLSGSFALATEHMYKNGLKALFKLRKATNMAVSADTFFHLLDSLVVPVVTYSCETWFVNSLRTKNTMSQAAQLYKRYEGNPIEKLHIMAQRMFMGIHNRSVKSVMYSETGRCPLYGTAISRTLAHMQRIMQTSDHLLTLSWQEQKRMFANSTDCWLKQLASNYDITQYMTPEATKAEVNLRECKSSLVEAFNGFIQKANLASSKLDFYNSVKIGIGREPYLDKLRDSNLRRAVAQLRTSSHKLEIEMGRHKNLDRDKRLCHFCTSGEIENEMHFLVKCNNFIHERSQLYAVANRECNNFSLLTDTDKAIWLMTSESAQVINALAKYTLRGFRTRVENNQSPTILSK
jgi:hypothetical protein